MHITKFAPRIIHWCMIFSLSEKFLIAASWNSPFRIVFPRLAILDILIVFVFFYQNSNHYWMKTYFITIYTYTFCNIKCAIKHWLFGSSYCCQISIIVSKIVQKHYLVYICEYNLICLIWMYFIYIKSLWLWKYTESFYKRIKYTIDINTRPSNMSLW